MQIGIDDFAAAYDEGNSGPAVPPNACLGLVEEMDSGARFGLNVFGVGEHHRKDYLDSAPATVTWQRPPAPDKANPSHQRRDRLIQFGQSCKSLSELCQLSIFSKGKGGNGRRSSGSSLDSFPLFGFKLDDYDELFAENSSLLLKVQS